MRKMNESFYLFVPGDEETKVSQNFKAAEFKCLEKRQHQWLVAEHLVLLLQSMRNYIGKPITIESAFRTWTHNVVEKGASNSRHLYGMAADIKVAGLLPIEVAAVAWHFGCRRIGIGNTFTHVDVDKPVSGSEDIWDYGQKPSPTLEQLLVYVNKLG
jgi:hypothetical protein